MTPEGIKISWFDRFLISLAPGWGMRRIRARAAARYYEAAQQSRRTFGWRRTSADANAANGPALVALRELSRDLRRNNGWAKRGIQAITNNVVGWGIMPKASDANAALSKNALKIWNAWANSTRCDFDGRLNFYGLQRLAMDTIIESGEVLIVKHPAATKDGLAIPLRIQVLEPDYLDANRLPTKDGGEIIDGVEFDAQGRRVAYWLISSHPGANRLTTSGYESKRIPADRVLHVYHVDRPGQVRGVPWLASAITRLKDLDDFEDAELMQQKVAACFGAFVTDPLGTSEPLGATGRVETGIESLEPGQIQYLKPGETVTFATPPRAQESTFPSRVLRGIAVSLGVPYEEMTGDYSQVNFSSARMARLAHWQNVHEWRWQMLIPQLCDGVWAWAMEMMVGLNNWPEQPLAQWAPPPMPILEPDAEGSAYQRLLRLGAMTWPQMVRELGYDPTEQLEEIERFNADVDKRGIILDCDPRYMSAVGQAQLVAPPSKDEGDDTTTDDKPVDDNAAPPPPPKKPPEPPADDAGDTAPADDGGDVSGKKPAPPAESRVFAYHQPFMKVKEIREGIGLPGAVTDSELFANEFLAKHSPKPAGAADDGSVDTTSKK